MKLKTSLRNLLFYIMLHVLSTHAWAQHINLNQTQVVINNDLKFNLMQLPGHDYTYDLQLPSEETSDKPTKGTVLPYNGTIMNFYRNDTNNNIATLKVSDSALGNITIWKGIITYDPNSQQLTYQVLQQSRQYSIKITLSKLEKNSIPQFKIVIFC